MTHCIYLFCSAPSTNPVIFFPPLQHLLDLRPDDFEQELQLQRLKGDISKAIRQNTSLEKEVDAMDIKIGLLVKNRISVQEVRTRRVTRLALYIFGALCSNKTNDSLGILVNNYEKRKRMWNDFLTLILPGFTLICARNNSSFLGLLILVPN